MYNRSRSMLYLLCSVIFFYFVIYTAQNESLSEVWPTIWGLLWGKLMLLDLYIGFVLIALLMRELCQWSLRITVLFLLLCCILGNGVSLIGVALFWYRKVHD